MACAPCSLGSLVAPVISTRPGYAMLSYEHFCAPASCSLITETELCLASECGAIIDFCNTPLVTIPVLASERSICMAAEDGSTLLLEQD